MTAMDSISPQERSALMGRVRSKNSGPEMLVRQVVFGLGYRYRLHAKDLPGTPDMVFRGRGKVIFIHGCFWHRHTKCVHARLPKSRLEFWVPKLNGNKRRDQKNRRALVRRGWKVLTIWECELKNETGLHQRITRFLNA